MTELSIRPLSEAIGASVGGVDLREPLADDVREALRGALRDHLALVLRNQPLAPQQLIDFGRQLGELRVHPFAPHHPDHDELQVIDQVHPVGEGADSWHADATFMDEPPSFGVLQAMQVPPVGGDTLFASAIAAYEALSPPVREFLLGLEGVHDISRQLSKAIHHGHSSPELESLRETWPERRQPVVRTDPTTGRRALFVNGNFTTRIEGLSEAESRLWLSHLLPHIGSPAFSMRLAWEPHTVAIWDNRYAQHFAVPDYRERRVMHRLNIGGEPVR